MVRAFYILLILILVVPSARAQNIRHFSNALQLYMRELEQGGKQVEEQIRKTGTAAELGQYRKLSSTLVKESVGRFDNYYRLIVDRADDFGAAFRFANGDESKATQYFANELAELAKEIAGLQRMLDTPRDPYRSTPPEQLKTEIAAKLTRAKNLHEEALALECYQSNDRITKTASRHGLAILAIAAAIAFRHTFSLAVGPSADIGSAVVAATAYTINNVILEATVKAVSAAILGQIRLRSTAPKGHLAALSQIAKSDPIGALAIRRLVTSLTCHVKYENVPDETKPVTEGVQNKVRVEPAKDFIRVNVEPEQPRLRIDIGPSLEEIEFQESVQEGLRHQQKLLRKNF